MATEVGSKKWIYHFSEGNAAMRDLLGGKGAGLAEMTNIGLSVPPGFTITTEACRIYNDLGDDLPDDVWQQTMAALKRVEEESGKVFGSADNPLLVSVRSGAKFSMPGMMDTVLNLGLNESTLEGIIALTGNPRFAYDAYRRFIQMFGKVVMGMDGAAFDSLLDDYKEQVGAKSDTDLSEEDLKRVFQRFIQLIEEETGREFVTDPFEQLRLAISAVFSSWNNKRAVDFRNSNNIPHDLGTAVSVVTMVFGNMGDDSGTGVAFTRNPSTGENALFGEYLPNAQGEDVVAGTRTPKKISELKRDWPELYQQFVDIAKKLEAHYKDVQDIEFTIERRKLYILQTRSAKRSARAAVRIAVDMVREGIIGKEDAVRRVEPTHLEQLLLPSFDESAKSASTFLTKGLNASPGAATGKAVLDADLAYEMGLKGEDLILVRPETNPDDVHGVIHSRGVLTARGGVTSHAAVVARGLGKPCVAGCEDLEIDLERKLIVVDGKKIREFDEISIDGATGEVFLGKMPTVDPDFYSDQGLLSILNWADEIRRLQVWANADYPRDAERALQYGAQGIGLCRTEHMFFEEGRLPVVRQMILAADEATALQNAHAALQAELSNATDARRQYLGGKLSGIRRRMKSSDAIKTYHEALDKLLEYQTEDFRGLLRCMHGKPVIIRLLDPPLHEFLPSYDELLVETTELKIRGNDQRSLKEKEVVLRKLESMREANPMLGLRGVRLGILYKEIYQMQVRAIMIAACELVREGVDARPEIMIPLVGHFNELSIVRADLERVAQEVQGSRGVQARYKFGTMIELPRAALTADQIARHVEFFSFGTNDLTQATYGYSRDDAEAKFLLQYVARKILPDNPFQVLDRDGVGKLMAFAVAEGRKTRQDLEVGICGEHGGDPSSIWFCHEIGLDYVSASPFRVPVARLAAAQAALASVELDR